MLDYLLNMSHPVFIYFITFLVLVFIQTLISIKKKEMLKYMITIIFVSIFLEFLYRKDFKFIVWSIALGPFICIFLILCLFLFMFFFYKKKEESLLDRLKLLKSILYLIPKLMNISLINQLKTLMNIG